MDFLKIRFAELLIEANDFDSKDFKHWLFCPAMLFNSPDKWWGDHGRRDFPHEGLDFCLYEGRSGQIMRLDPETRIPVLQNGVVRAVFADYLGQAVVVEHTDSLSQNGRWLSVYAHTRPIIGLQPGVVVKKGSVIATIADTSQSKAGIFPHLHLSLGHPLPDLTFDGFVWNHMRNPNLIVLSDPLAIVRGFYRVLDSQDRNCTDA